MLMLIAHYLDYIDADVDADEVFSQAGANINSACGPRGEGRTPLHIAAEHGHMVNAQVLYLYQALARYIPTIPS